MAPRVSVLQLDTHFPRIPGDVGCPDTFTSEVEIIRIKGADVKNVVSPQPELIDIAPFEHALKRAKGDVVVTSCGFLSYWQSHLARRTDKPFISSSLTALEHLSLSHAPGEVLILTFDETALTTKHLGAFQTYSSEIIGLPKQCHLRKVISENQTSLNAELAKQELSYLLAKHQRSTHKHLLLECTNLPPYKALMQQVTGLPITDLLTLIEAQAPGAIDPQFL